MEACIVFPHQLFSDSKILKRNRLAVLIEHPLFFTQLKFHRKKLLLHRASMKSYQAFLEKNGYQTFYIDFYRLSSLVDIEPDLKSKHIDVVHIYDVVDDWLGQDIAKLCPSFAIHIHESPNYLTTSEDCERLLNDATTLRMSSFYISQRRRLGILLDGDGPVGGSWSYDTQNRKRLPKSITLPSPNELVPDEFVEEARRYVETHFSDNPGSMINFEYPWARSKAQDLFADFLDRKLHFYGDFQDAMSAEQSFLYHSVLSIPLNIGILGPQEVVEQALQFADAHQVPLNSLEGFVRQVIGWREFVRGVYQIHGRRQRTTNYFKHVRRIPESFWSASTGIDPIDRVLQRVLETGYANHIERLMLFSNFFLLCEFDPDEVYEWFSALFIDAYDWVMVPNVYGMGLYADGGLMVTKPYVSSSNYVRKMSNFCKGPWCEIWDALYWRFMYHHRELFGKNPRTRMTLSHLDKMGADKLKGLLKTADNYLASLE
jgi:deoxyribodipyrimidine photolyase-related protein